jgi:hypothetical protein
MNRAVPLHHYSSSSYGMSFQQPVESRLAFGGPYKTDIVKNNNIMSANNHKVGCACIKRLQWSQPFTESV